MMFEPWTPYLTAFDLAPFDVMDLGYALAGKITDLVFSPVGNGSFLIEYEADYLGGLDEELTALYLFEDGECVAKTKGGQPLVYTPARDKPYSDLELYLFPDDESFEAWGGAGLYMGRDQVRLSWSYAGRVYKVGIFYNAGASVTATTAKKVILTPTPALEQETAESGGKLFVSGSWTDSEIKIETITVTITTGGVPGTAVAEWVMGERGDSITLQDRPIHIVNGIRIHGEEDFAYEVGDSWTINIDLPKRWETQPLEDGQYAFKIAAYTKAGESEDSNTVTRTVNAPPPPPVFSESSYVDGTGSIEITWDIPNEADIVTANIYKNRLDLDEKVIHHFPVASYAVTPGSPLTVDVDDLAEGVNRIVCRLMDDAGQEEQNLDWVEIHLDASLDEYTNPNAPFDLRAVEIPGDLVRVTVDVDDTSDTINIYKNDGDEVDYETVIDTIANPGASDNQTLSVDIDWTPYGAGTFTLAARAQSGSYEESNTDVLRVVAVELADAPVPVLDGVVF